MVLDSTERRQERRRLEEQAIQEGRLPPGQSLTLKWPVLHAADVPQFDLTTWRFRIWGLVERPRDLSWQDFSALPRTTSRSDIHCVTRWSKLDNVWEGPSGKLVLEVASPLPSARFALVHAPGYTANLPIEALRDGDVLFALKHGGEDLVPEHGYPVRLVVPSRYFWKSVKWVTGMEFIENDEPGFWEQRGYHNEGDPYREERFGI
jgi:DMSO/TMAO reductase YedYZ molybdopterin-dependent catalytic subunit